MPKPLRIVMWIGIALLGALAVATIALQAGDQSLPVQQVQRMGHRLARDAELQEHRAERRQQHRRNRSACLQGRGGHR